MDGQIWNLPTDAFAEILLRLPPSARRRVRLVCRHWRDVVDERFTSPHTQPMALAYVKTSTWGSAYVIEDLAEGRCRELWTSGVGRRFNTVMVGTCNGLLCLCDNNKPAGGAIYLINPVTGETLAVPRLPSSGHWASYVEHWRTYSESFAYGWHQTYSFAYLPVTGRYKFLHLPFHCDRTGGFNAVKVLTLGDAAAWRDVPCPGASCRLDAGIVCVGGAAYWVTKGAETVMAFDLEDESVASTGPIPVPPAGQSFLCHLTEAQGKLGLAISADNPAPVKTEVCVSVLQEPAAIKTLAICLDPDVSDTVSFVCLGVLCMQIWVLGGGRDQQASWVRWCSVQVHGVPQRLARPHFAHGKYVLTTDIARSRYCGLKELFVHRVRDAGRLLSGEVRSVRIMEPGTAVSGMGDAGVIHGTFAYVETTESLSDYRLKRTPAVRRGRPLKQ
ncbi:hypothetical protein EJB05_48513, partial [Eragrostis curvula]